MTLLTEALILGLFAMSLDLMVGYTRLVSFGHAAAYGFGAYACGWLLLHTSLPMLATIPISALLAYRAGLPGPAAGPGGTARCGSARRPPADRKSVV